MDAQTTNTAPLLSRENLCKFYRPLGYEPMGYDWTSIAQKSYLPKYFREEIKGVVIHVVAWENNELLALVANKKDLAHPDKYVGIGVPTEELKVGEIPYEVATGRTMTEELGLTDGFSIDEYPLTVRLDKRNVLHITFRGILDEYTEIPKIIEDPAGEIEGAYLVNPFSTIRIHKEQFPGGSRFTPKIGEKDVYSSHLGLIALSLMKG